MNNKTIGIIVLLLVVAVVTVFAIDFSRDHDKEPLVNNEGNQTETEAQVPELESHEWNWQKTAYADGKEIVAKEPERFVLSFDPKEERFHSKTDCNGLSGAYKLKEGGGIEFSSTISTLMFCEGSQENEYKKEFEEVNGYSVTENNLVLKFEGGEMLFSKVK